MANAKVRELEQALSSLRSDNIAPTDPQFLGSNPRAPSMLWDLTDVCIDVLTEAEQRLIRARQQAERPQCCGCCISYLIIPNATGCRAGH